RDPRQVSQQADLLADRIRAGHRILIFAEGTSSDGARVLPFRASLFAAFLKAAPMDLQPVTLRYTAPQGQDARFYGWWGGMELGPSLRAVLASRRAGGLTVTFHDPIPVDAGTQRKALAKTAEMAVRSAL
ncbi:MAG: 1-acyl-sn-glycerol-3-phosphate acyltransferase, partial [Pseudomonadota bacterium]